MSQGTHARLVDQHENIKRLANQPKLERVYVPDEMFMLEALRVVLGLPRRTPFGQEA